MKLIYLTNEIRIDTVPRGLVCSEWYVFSTILTQFQVFCRSFRHFVEFFDILSHQAFCRNRVFVVLGILSNQAYCCIRPFVVLGLLSVYLDLLSRLAYKVVSCILSHQVIRHFVRLLGLLYLDVLSSAIFSLGFGVFRRFVVRLWCRQAFCRQVAAFKIMYICMQIRTQRLKTSVIVFVSISYYLYLHNKFKNPKVSLLRL